MAVIMTNEEAIAIIRKEYLCVDRDCNIERSCGNCDLVMPSKEPILQAYKMAIKALEQEPILDKISAEISEQKDCVALNDDDLFWYRHGLNDAIEIVDKYRQEG